MANLTGTRSNFPDSIDAFMELTELPQAKLADAAAWRALKIKTRTPEEDITFNALTQSLASWIFTPEIFNKMGDAIVNLENFFDTEVHAYIEGKQLEFNQYIDTKTGEFDDTLDEFSDKEAWSGATTYKKWNTVTYNYETHMSKVDGNLNHAPTGQVGDPYWQRIAARGAQGVPGVDMSFLGTYSPATTYNENQMVYYNEVLYYCLNNGVLNQVPDLNPQDWAVFIDGRKSIYVSATQPANPVLGMIWLEISE